MTTTEHTTHLAQLRARHVPGCDEHPSFCAACKKSCDVLPLVALVDAQRAALQTFRQLDECEIKEWVFPEPDDSPTYCDTHDLDAPDGVCPQQRLREMLDATD